MLFTIILYVIPYICGIYAVSAQSGSIIALMFPLVVGNLPTLLFIISSILGLTSKAKPRIIKDANNNETPIINKSEIKYCEYCGSAISESTGICTNCNAKNIK